MRKLLLFLFLCLSMPLMASDANLVLKMKDGTTHSFLLSSEPKITISGYQLHFSGKDIDVSFNAIDVSEYSFDLPSGMSTAKSDISYQMENNNLVITGKVKGIISVHNTAGQLMQCNVTSGADKSTVHLSSLLSGVYIIKVNNVTIKVRTK